MEYKIKASVYNDFITFIPHPACEIYEIYKVNTNIDGIKENILVQTINSNDDVYFQGRKPQDSGLRIESNKIEGGYTYLFYGTDYAHKDLELHTLFSIGYGEHRPYNYYSGDALMFTVGSLLIPIQDARYREVYFSTPGWGSDIFYTACRINNNFYRFYTEPNKEYFILGKAGELSDSTGDIFISDVLLSKQYAILYNNKSEDIVLNKELVNAKEIPFVFRNEVSLTNPIVRIEDNCLFDYNYIYINGLNRYYYIDEIVFVRTNIYDLHCREDVLMSFKEEILNQNVFLTRQEYNYNNYLLDNKFPATIVDNIDYLDCEFDIYQNDIENNFTGIGYNKFSILLTLSNIEHLSINRATDLIAMENIYFIDDVNMLIQDMYIDRIEEALRQLFTKASDAVLSLRVYPFENFRTNDNRFLKELDRQGTKIQYGALKVDNVTTSLRGTPLRSTVGVVTIGYFNLVGKFDNFLNYSPYSVYEVYLPFIGWYNLDSRLFLNKWIRVDYSIDIKTGDTTVLFVSGSTKEEIKVKYPTIEVDGITDIIDGDIDVPQGNILEVFATNIGRAVNISSIDVGTGHLNALLAGLKGAVNAVSIGTVGMPISSTETTVGKYNYSRKTGSMTSSNVETTKSKEYKPNISGAINKITDTTVDVISSLRGEINSGNVNIGTSSWGYIQPFTVRRRTLTIPNDFDKSLYNNLLGSPSSYIGKLKDLKGYTEVGGVHLDGFEKALNTEKDEIDQILRTGIRL